MQINEYIRLNFGGRQNKYAAAMGFREDQVSRWCRLDSCLVNDSGLPHPAAVSRKKRAKQCLIALGETLMITKEGE